VLTPKDRLCAQIGTLSVNLPETTVSIGTEIRDLFKEWANVEATPLSREGRVHRTPLPKELPPDFLARILTPPKSLGCGWFHDQPATAFLTMTVPSGDLLTIPMSCRSDTEGTGSGSSRSGSGSGSRVANTLEDIGYVRDSTDRLFGLFLHDFMECMGAPGTIETTGIPQSTFARSVANPHFGKLLAISYLQTPTIVKSTQRTYKKQNGDTIKITVENYSDGKTIVTQIILNPDGSQKEASNFSFGKAAGRFVRDVAARAWASILEVFGTENVEWEREQQQPNAAVGVRGYCIQDMNTLCAGSKYQSCWTSAFDHAVANELRWRWHYDGCNATALVRPDSESKQCYNALVNPTGLTRADSAELHETYCKLLSSVMSPTQEESNLCTVSSTLEKDMVRLPWESICRNRAALCTPEQQSEPTPMRRPKPPILPVIPHYVVPRSP
jgi:hypothetical protein